MQLVINQPRVRALVRRLLTAALDAADPGSAVARSVSRQGSRLRVATRTYHLPRYGRIFVAGAGKASGQMAAALERILGDRITDGLVTVKYGHAVPTRTIRTVEAGHPVPDRPGLEAATQTLAMVRALSPKDLLIVLLSGGASSLWPAPAPGLTLKDKQTTTRLLLNSGATIQELNTVRKHLSSIKGGRLAQACRAPIITLALSDVLGDDVSAIGSGPTVPDPATFADAVRVIRRYHLWRDIPERVRAFLMQGQQGRVPESPKPGDALFRRVQYQVIGNNQRAVEAAAHAVAQHGVRPLVLTTTLMGEAREAARVFGALAREIHATGRPVGPPACVMAGGELTVTVRGPGRGGRAQEFAVAAAREIAGLPNTWIIACGTDGTDGPTDAAGAITSGHTMRDAATLGFDLNACLDQNDTYHCLRRLGSHIVTGPTGTNVNDLYLLLVL